MPDPRAQLLSVVYASVATEGLGSIDLDELLAESRIRNHARGITGMLLAEDGRFLQAIEGPEDAVRELLTAIEQDPRHRDVRVLALEPSAQRRFPDWAMGHGHLDDAGLDASAGSFAVLLEARGELPAAPSRGERLRTWFRGGSPSVGHAQP